MGQHIHQLRALSQRLSQADQQRRMNRIMNRRTLAQQITQQNIAMSNHINMMWFGRSFFGRLKFLFLGR